MLVLSILYKSEYREYLSEKMDSNLKGIFSKTISGKFRSVFVIS